MVALGAGAIYLATTDLRPLLERQAGAALEREVALGELRIGWGRSLSLEARDLRIANASWGDEPDMIRIARLSAVVDLAALLRGVVRYERLSIDGFELLLERKADGARNWRFAGAAPSPDSATAAGLAAVPKNRRQFPDLQTFSLRDSEIIYRSEGRADIRIALDDASVGAPDAVSPVGLSIAGAYNALPVALQGETGSFAQMRDASRPFDAALVIESGPARIDFKGGLDEPLDFEGVAGRLDLAVENVAAFLEMLGEEWPADYAMTLGGEFRRDDLRWRLSQAAGRIGDSAVSGDLSLVEGGRGEADAVALDLAADRLDLAALGLWAAEADPSQPSTDDEELFRPDAEPAVTFDARLAAQSVLLGALAMDDVSLHGRLQPGAVIVESAAFGFAGGRVETSGAARAQAQGTALALNAAYADADLGRLTERFGLEAGMLTGKLDGRLNIAMTGRTLREALGDSRGQAAVVMRGGRIERSLVEKVSLNLLALLRRNETTTPIECLLAVVDVQNGSGRVMPLRLRSGEGMLAGGGAVDLASGQVDLLVKSERDSTGFLALDLPLQITGPFDDLAVSPRLDGGPAWLAETPELPAALDPGVRQLIAGNPCLG